MLQGLQTFIEIESLITSGIKLVSLSESEKGCELMASLSKIDTQKVINLSNLIVSSLEVESGRKQINIKSGIFEELD
jgi:hypothetical protein